MKKLCLGTLLTILTQAKVGKQNVLFYNVLSFLDRGEKYKNESDQSHYKTGTTNFADYANYIGCDKDALVQHYEKQVLPCLQKSLFRHIVLAIKNVLREDPIPQLTQIGFDPGYTKQDIVNSYHFNMAELLANVFYYCIVDVHEQRPYKPNIAEIGAHYLESLSDGLNDIDFSEAPTPVAPTISPTVARGTFGTTFREAAAGTLSLPNSNQVKVYALDIANGKIDYDQLKEFILKNIGRYVFSRAKRNRYELEGGVEAISLKAVQAYARRVGKSPETNHFNEIMLYSFLESALGAPKIFSKMELQGRSGEYESVSSGIHVLCMRKGLVPFNQIVLGASDTDDDVKTAIDHAFAQVSVIASASKQEYELIQSAVYDCAFDNDTNKALEEILIPKKGIPFSKPDNAFGLFLGYSIKVEDDWLLSEDEFRAEAEKKMQKDIDDVIPYIESKVSALGLKGYSFYVYFLPLNEAIKDKDSIIQEALFQGGDC